MNENEEEKKQQREALSKRLSESSQRIQDNLRYLREKRQSKLFGNYRENRDWLSGIAKISFTIAVALLPILFVSGDSSISTYGYASFLILLFNGAYLTYKVKQKIEDDNKIAILWGISQEQALVNQMKAIWFLQKNLDDEQRWKEYARTEIELTRINGQAIPKIDYDNDVALTLLPIGLYLLAHDFVGDQFQSGYFLLGGVIVVLLAVLTSISIDSAKNTNTKSNKNDLVLKNHSDDYESEIIKILKGI